MMSSRERLDVKNYEILHDVQFVHKTDKDLTPVTKPN